MIAFQQFYETVDKTYNKANLENFYNAFFQDFLQRNQELLQKRGVDNSILQKQKLYKADLAVPFAAVLYDKELFNLFLNALPEPVPLVWETLLLEGPVMYGTLEKQYGIKIAHTKNSYSSEIIISPLFLCFSFKSEYKHQMYGEGDKIKVVFYVEPELRRHLLLHIEIPDKFKLQPVQQPENVDFIYEDQHGILEEMPLFLAYYLQDEIKYSSSGKPLPGSVNKMRKFCSSREFFPDNKEEKELLNLRAHLIANALPLIGDEKQFTLGVPELLKGIMHNFSAGKLSVLYSLLIHLKGTGYVKNGYENRGVNYILYNVLQSLKMGEWYEFENLRRYVALYHKSLMPVPYYVAYDYLYMEVTVKGKYGNYKDRYNPKEETYAEMISYPLLRASMFFFAALGLVDIAYDYPNNEAAEPYGFAYFSVWDGLRYVRLTPLGAYVLGQTNTYEPPKVEKSGELYLEEDLLIINYTGNDKIMTMMLEKVASQSTATRYKVDYQSFLKDCTTQKDIQNKIEIFRTHIDAKPPQVWEAFFQELLNKYNPLQKENKLRVFRVPPDNKELIALLARDEVLKKLVIKAEQYYILVNEKDMPSVRTRLEKFGYLLERGK